MGIAFYHAHRSMKNFPESWKIYLSFFISYLIGLYSICLVIPFFRSDSDSLAGIEDRYALAWHFQGLMGVTALLGTLRLTGIQIGWRFVVLLVLLGSTCPYLFYAKWAGDYWLFTGFPIWQALIGTVLSIAILQKRKSSLSE